MKGDKKWRTLAALAIAGLAIAAETPALPAVPRLVLRLGAQLGGLLLGPKP